MARPLDAALAEVRALLLDDARLRRALGAGRRRGHETRWRRVEVRYVDLRAGRHLQVTAYDATQAFTRNHALGADAERAVDGLLAEPFGNWHVDTLDLTLQVRVTKRGEAMVHRSEQARPPDSAVLPGAAAPDRRHDRTRHRLLDAGDPFVAALGGTDRKRRQVEELLRALVPTVREAVAAGRLREPSATNPLRVADLGCGNAHLTLAALHHLDGLRLPCRVVGVDVKEQSKEHDDALAARLGVADRAHFVVAPIATVTLDPAPDVVLALHACDTATDDVLARAIGWRSAVVLAAPCCHHDIAAQLRRAEDRGPYAVLTRHGILRERLADTLTDGLRAAILRREGYRVDVVEFVESRHTPRNTLLRAVRTGVPSPTAATEVEAITTAWSLRPALEDRLAEHPAAGD